MKKGITLAMMILIVTGLQASDHGSVGLGLQIGVPAGITAKFWMGERSAVDLTVGWNLNGEYADAQTGYLYHFPFSVSAGWSAAYTGIRARVSAWGNDADMGWDGEVRFAAGAILGLEYVFKRLGLFAEIDPLVNIIPEPQWDYGGGIGLRYYF